LQFLALFLVLAFSSLSPQPAEAEELHETNPSAHETILLAQARTERPDPSSVVIEEGKGFGAFTFQNRRCNKAFIKSALGEPAGETVEWLNYAPQYGVRFRTARTGGPLREVRLERGFKGRLSSNVSLATPMQGVFSAYGMPLSEQTVDSLENVPDADKTLYRLGDRSKIEYAEQGLIFFFEGDAISQISLFMPRPQWARSRTASLPEEPAPAMDSAPPAKPVSVRPLEPKVGIAGGPSPDLTKLAEADLPPGPRWGPLVRIDRLWRYVKENWVLAFLVAAALTILLFPVPGWFRRMYYRWRPLPEGRLIIIRDPSQQLEANVNIWYRARQLKKRTLLVGSSEDADVLLCHDSVKPQHALIRAQRSEGGIITYIEPLGDGKVAVNDDDGQGFRMSLNDRARVKIGKFLFQYEQPSEYRQVQVRYKNGKKLEGVPTSWDIESDGFIMLPSRARSWMDAKFIAFSKLKGVYFMREWDEDVRKKLMRGGKDLFKHPATIRFLDREIVPGYLIGDYSQSSRRFYLFPHDQGGDVVYILVERSSTEAIQENKHSDHAEIPAD
jgi:hypothetical protein